jgi:hypothetical protein
MAKTDLLQMFKEEREPKICGVVIKNGDQQWLRRDQEDASFVIFFCEAAHPATTQRPHPATNSAKNYDDSAPFWVKHLMSPARDNVRGHSGSRCPQPYLQNPKSPLLLQPTPILPIPIPFSEPFFSATSDFSTNGFNHQTHNKRPRDGYPSVAETIIPRSCSS